MLRDAERPCRPSARRRSGSRNRTAAGWLSPVRLRFSGLFARLVDFDRQRPSGHLSRVFGIVGEGHELHVVRIYRTRREDLVLHPFKQSRPVRAAEEHDGKVLDLARLSEGERLEELVQSTEATWKD